MSDVSTAMTIWAEARERVANELATKAASLSRSGFEAEAARLRSIVRVLRVRALQEFAHVNPPQPTRIATYA